VTEIITYPVFVGEKLNTFNVKETRLVPNRMGTPIANESDIQFESVAS
jgi:hypothetical protein